MKILARVRHLRQWINQSIQRKLVLRTIGFWVISIAILSLITIIVGQTVIINESRQRNIQMASMISRDINSQISGILSDTRQFSRYLEVTSPDLKVQASEILGVRLSSLQRYRAAYYFDASGQLLFHLTDTPDRLLNLNPEEIIARPPLPIDNEVSTAYKEAHNSGTFISEVRFVGLDNVPVFYLGVTLNFPQELSRVLIFEIDLRDIWQRIDLATVGKSGFTFAVSREGLIIAHPQPASIGRIIPPEINLLVQGFEGFTEYYEPSQGREVIAAYSPVGGPTGWGIVVVQDRAEAYAPIIQAGYWIIGICLALALIGTFGILMTIRSFTRPIIELTQTTQNIARTGDLTKSALVKRPDEVGQMSQAFDQMIERLQNTEVKLEHAAADERNRLARDLHDAVSQTLFSASLIAEVLPRLWERNQPEALKRLEEVRQLTRGALAEMRTLLLELRPSSLAEAEMDHLMRQLAESITGRSRIPVTVQVEGQCAVPTEVKVALYRISQEALNNVAKHSGAKEATLSLVCQPGQVSLTVKDNGRGFNVQNASTKSLGLGIIRERAREIQALLFISSQPEKGTEISVVWKNNQLPNQL